MSQRTREVRRGRAALAAERRLQTVSLLVVAAVAVGGALYWLRPVLIPLGLAAFVYLTLTPMVDWMVLRRGWPRPLAALLALLPAIGLMAGFGVITAFALRRLTHNVDRYRDNLYALAERVLTDFPSLGPLLDPVQLQERLSQIEMTDVLLGTTNAFFGMMANFTLVLIFVLFLTLGHEPREPSPGTLRYIIDTRIRRYLVVKFGVSLVTGVIVGLLLSGMDVELPVVFGLLTFMLNFIPSIGSIVATLLPLPMVLVSPDVTLTRVLLVLAVPGSIQFTIGNLIEPKVLGDSLDLHPVTVLAALVFWGALWGGPGMLMAAPITAVLKILLEGPELTRPVARLMAGRRASLPPPPAAS